MTKKRTFTVREATQDDVPVMVEFLVALGLHVSGGQRQTLTREAEQRLQSFLSGYLDDRDKHLVVACSADGEVVGMGNIHIWHSPNLWEEAGDLDQKSGFIDDLWVEPACRKQGIMTLILKELVRFAESHGIEELILEYSLSNEEAAAVWERLGFKPTGVRAAAGIRSVREKLWDG
jgi:ribosomal protein S18 acetylase RimI-like enzyme